MACEIKRRSLTVCLLTTVLMAATVVAANAQPPEFGPIAVTVENTPLMVTSTSPNEPGRQPYETIIQFTNTSCAVGSDCSSFSTGTLLASLFFGFDGAEIPNGKRLVVEHVNGTVPVMDTVAVSVQLVVEHPATPLIGAAVKWGFYGPYYLGSNGFSPRFSASAFTTYGPGERPHVRISAPAAAAFPNSAVALGYVTVSGYLVDVAN